MIDYLYWAPMGVIYLTCCYFLFTTRSSSNLVSKHPLGYEGEQKQFDIPKDTSNLPAHLTLFIQPKSNAFSGYEIYQTLSSSGLKYGEHQMFHLMHDSGIVFSVCDANAPGALDLNDLGQTECPNGLAAFIDTQSLQFNPQHLKLFVDTSKLIAEDLDANIILEDQSPLEPSTIDIWHSQYFATESA
tara:strand:- start:2239 stop:2799 length:561 start_codon:yes stop_codon:yes gene_type:complete